MATPQVLEIFERNLRYWHTTVTAISAHPEQLVKDLPRCHHAITQVLPYPVLRRAAAELLVALLPLLERSGYTVEWLKVADILLVDKARFPRALAAQLHVLAGVLCRLQRHNTLALQHHHAALDHALLVKDASLIGRCQLQLSISWRECGGYPSARIHAKAALPLWRSDEPQWRAATYNALGMIAHQQGNYAEAEQWLRQAVTLGMTLPDYTLELARSWNNLALALQAMQQWDAALEGFTRATQLLDATAHTVDRTRVALSLGSLHYNQKRYATAETIFRTINRDLLHERGLQYYEALTLHNLGNVLVAQGRYNEADFFLHAAIPLWEMVGDVVMLANSVGTQGEAHAGRGDVARARKHYQQAVEWLSAQPVNERTLRVLRYFTALLDA